MHASKLGRQRKGQQLQQNSDETQRNVSSQKEFQELPGLLLARFYVPRLKIRQIHLLVLM